MFFGYFIYFFILYTFGEIFHLSSKKFCMKIPSLSISRRYIFRFNVFDTNFIQPTSMVLTVRNIRELRLKIFYQNQKIIWSYKAIKLNMWIEKQGGRLIACRWKHWITFSSGLQPKDCIREFPCVYETFDRPSANKMQIAGLWTSPVPLVNSPRSLDCTRSREPTGSC